MLSVSHCACVNVQMGQIVLQLPGSLILDCSKELQCWLAALGDDLAAAIRKLCPPREAGVLEFAYPICSTK